MTNRRPPQHPLDHLPTLKWRVAVIIVAAIVVTDTMFYLVVKIDRVWPAVAGAIAGVVALVVVWALSRGTLEPLREMTAATERIARGELSTRVPVESRDEIGRLADSFNRMAGELEQTDRMRRDLVANVSHELRTPIAALQARLENLVDGVETADPETLGTMHAQTVRLGRLVTQLLDLSRLESGAVPLETRAFSVGPMLEHAVRESQLARPDARIDCEVEPPDLQVDGDPERLHQVVANLVENAVRHSPPGSVVTVAATRDHTDRSVRIEVADEGPGIPESDRDLVFERFYRADKARASSGGGAGLGLAIARWIVDLHGGRIRPEAREPHGCRMVVTLPPGDARTRILEEQRA